MKRELLNLSRRALLCTAFAAFACRLMIPAGYMPAAWGEGGPISLCPMGLPVGLLPEQSGHHHHDEHGETSGSDLLWEYCPQGALSDTASILPDAPFDLSIQNHVRPADIEPVSPDSPTLVSYRSRAPPSFPVV